MQAHQVLHRSMLSIGRDVGGLDEELVSAFRARRWLLLHGLQQDCGPAIRRQRHSSIFTVPLHGLQLTLHLDSLAGLDPAAVWADTVLNCKGISGALTLQADLLRTLFRSGGLDLKRDRLRILVADGERPLDELRQWTWIRAQSRRPAITKAALQEAHGESPIGCLG